MSRLLATLLLLLALALTGPAVARAADSSQSGGVGPRMNQPRVTYPELRASIARHQVREALIVPPRSEIRATLVNGRKVTVHYPAAGESELPGLLARSGADFAVSHDVKSGGVNNRFLFWVVGMVLVSAAIAAWTARRRRRAAAASSEEGGSSRSGQRGGESRGTTTAARRTESERPAVRFSDVAGCQEAVEEVREVLEFTQAPERFARLGARMPRGTILHGPPGTGKTLLAKALAGEAGLPFFAVSGSDFVEKYVGTGASRVRELFRNARAEEEGAVIFIDEIDAVGQRRSGADHGNAESEKTLNQLLVELDGFDTSEKVVCLAATNRLDTLDEALLRPGRFGRQVHVDVPSEPGRLEMLELHGRDKPFAEDVSLPRLARITAGSSGADLAEMLNEAAIMSARAGRERIGQAELEEGHLRVLAGPLKQSSMLADGEGEIVAVHEAGHVLVAELSPTHEKAERATVQPRGRAAGLAVYGRLDRSLMSERYVHERLMAVLGGRAAEFVAFGRISSGAANDLQQANALARQAVEELGFSARVGQMVSRGPSGAVRLADETLGAIDQEVGRLVADAYRDAIALLRANEPSLRALATALEQMEAIDRLEIIAILEGTEPAVPAPARPLPPHVVEQPLTRPRGAAPSRRARGKQGSGRVRRAIAAFLRPGRDDASGRAAAEST